MWNVAATLMGSRLFSMTDDDIEFTNDIEPEDE